jgi:glycosyltransferase EpsF
MANADIMILPSLHEGFPVVLVESQAVGLSTLVSDNVSQEVDLGLG